MRQLLGRIVALTPQSLLAMDFRVAAGSAGLLAKLSACASDCAEIGAMQRHAALMRADVNARYGNHISIFCTPRAVQNIPEIFVSDSE